MSKAKPIISFVVFDVPLENSSDAEPVYLPVIVPFKFIATAK